MYRWPLRLADDPTVELTLEVPPRGAAFTLSALMHLGHPIQLALLDAYLRGEVPFAPGSKLGQDSRTVLANLVGPLVALRELGRDRATLVDLTLLPPERQAAGHSRFLLPSATRRSVRVACGSRLGRQTAGLPKASREPPSLQVVTILPTSGAVPDRHASSPRHAPLTVLTSVHQSGPTEGTNDVPPPDTPGPTTLSIGSSAETASPINAAWARLETLLARPLDERWTEPIVLRLVGPNRATELQVGWSLVLPRNQQVFAAWLGSDGRLQIRLQPP